MDTTQGDHSTITGPATSPPKPRAKTVRVAQVLDGNTIDLQSGKRIRLVQIDAPESSGECYGDQASRALSRILPPGTRVVLESDPVVDSVDRYGRALRYVHKGRANVNLLLVRRGAASVWFFDGDRGRYADRLFAAARNAKADGRGLWRACRLATTADHAERVSARLDRLEAAQQRRAALASEIQALATAR